MAPTVNSLFCGIGGFDLGFQQVGYTIVGAWDFDKYAVQSYKHNVGDHVKQADISEMNAADLSVAGKQAGMQLKCENQDCCEEWSPELHALPLWNPDLQQAISDGKDPMKCPKCGSEGRAATRSGLFFEVMRLLDETPAHNKPRVLVAENVKGLKPYLPVLQEEYAKRGYVMHVKLFNSKYWGVPQNRERYFVVGVRDGIEGFEFPEERKDNIPKLASVLEPVVDEKFYVSDEKAQKIIEKAFEYIQTKKKKGLQSAFTTDDGAAYCCLTDYNTGFMPGDVNKSRKTMIVEELQSAYTDKDSVAFCCDASYYKGLDPSHIKHQRRTGNIEERGIEVFGDMGHYGNDQMNRVYDPEGVSPSVMTCSGGGRHVKVLDYSRIRVRRLTPTEYGRLQGFPDTWEQVVSDSQAYKQFGNAVTVSVSKAVAEAVKRILKPKRQW